MSHFLDHTMLSFHAIDALLVSRCVLRIHHTSVGTGTRAAAGNLLSSTCYDASSHDAIVLFVNDHPVLPPFSERSTIVGTRSTDLLLCGFSYVQAQSAPKVVLGEGVPGIFSRDGTGTPVLQDWAVRLGYPPEALITTDQRVATHERALAIKHLLGPNKKILLIDSAIHLPRSAAAFRKAGFTVTPIPCDAYNMSTDSWNLSDFVPYAGNLEASNEAVYEYVGLLTYWLRGLI